MPTRPGRPVLSPKSQDNVLFHRAPSETPTHEGELDLTVRPIMTGMHLYGRQLDTLDVFGERDRVIALWQRCLPQGSLRGAGKIKQAQALTNFVRHAPIPQSPRKWQSAVI